MYPARHPDVIAVSATDANDDLAYFSCTGPEIDIAAPGYSVLSTVRGGTAYYSGTSMACPHVSGAAGLLMANGYSNTEARARLEETAEDIGLGSNEQGNGLLDVEAAMGGSGDSSPSVSIVSPSDGSTVSGTVTVQVDASDAEDSAGSLSVEVTIDGGVWNAALYSSSSGVYQYDWDTSEVADADYTIEARATDSGDNTVGSDVVSVSVDNTQETLDLSTIDTTGLGNASFSGSNGDYTIEAAGADVWKHDDAYGAVYEADVSGDVVAQTTVQSQENTHRWAKAGIMIANDITAAESSAGDFIVAVTPENGFIIDWDHNGDGFLSEHAGMGTTTYPCELRVRKYGTEFTADYSTDGGSTWTEVGRVSISNVQDTQDIGIFATSHDVNTKSTAEFADFQTNSMGLTTIDTTGAGNASFSGSDGDYVIKSAGADVWKHDDAYGAIYEANVSGDVIARTTVQSQENTHRWAKAGIMIANDITAAESSAGDFIVAVTPENGFITDWDHNGDGFLSEHAETGATEYPCDLRVTKSGTEFTADYSTDGGSTWTEINSVSISHTKEIQDVGVFATSHDVETKSTAKFVDFSLK
jgi:hypothetical protein